MLGALRAKIPTLRDINVGAINQTEASTYVSEALARGRRHLTNNLDKVSIAFSCRVTRLPRPHSCRPQAMTNFLARGVSHLSLRLGCAACLLWPSWVQDADTRLTNVPKELLNNHVVPALTARHAPALVRKALLYLSCARDGLSQAELLDILSLDDEVCLVAAARFAAIP